MSWMPGELIYDGDCGFCRRCVARWKQIASTREQAVPYQEAAERYPEIPLEEFRRAVQYIDGMGRRWSGAPAIFQSVKNVPGYGWLSWAYLHVPLFAPVCDWIYREVAGHRKTATWVTRMLWGASLDFPQYQTSVWLFRRVLAIIYAIAFISFGVQLKGLIGSQGILPAAEYLDAVKAEAGARWFLVVAWG
jgi:predicted DCC family thiol-disulfide oxidoreductase YuxK